VSCIRWFLNGSLAADEAATDVVDIVDVFGLVVNTTRMSIPLIAPSIAAVSSVVMISGGVTYDWWPSEGTSFCT
jgi:hypothetical protein